MFASFFNALRLAKKVGSFRVTSVSVHLAVGLLQNGRIQKCTEGEVFLVFLGYFLYLDPVLQCLKRHVLEKRPSVLPESTVVFLFASFLRQPKKSRVFRVTSVSVHLAVGLLQNGRT